MEQDLHFFFFKGNVCLEIRRWQYKGGGLGFINSSFSFADHINDKIISTRLLNVDIRITGLRFVGKFNYGPEYPCPFSLSLTFFSGIHT